MGPGPRIQHFARSASAPRDPLAPPSFNGDGNPMLWARRVAKWERAHDTLCDLQDKRGFPKEFRGYLLSQALYGTAYRTVESTLSDETINSKNGVKEILKLLAEFNPTTYAHEIFSAFKGLMRIRRKQNETFKLYVNRFEAAASELRNLTGQDEHGEAEQLLAFQLLEGAQIPTPVFLQVLSTCLTSTNKDQRQKTNAELENIAFKTFNEAIQALKDHDSEELKAALEGVEETKANIIIEIFQNGLENKAKEFDKIKGLFSDLAISSKTTKRTDVSLVAAVTIDFESAKKALRGLDAVSTASRGEHFSEPGIAGPSERYQPSKFNRQSLLTQQRGSNARFASNRPEKTKPQLFQKRMSPEEWNKYIASRKANSKCNACGEKGHWANDPQCTKSGLQTSPNKDQAEEKPELTFFR